jgi:hypothetical protein
MRAELFSKNETLIVLPTRPRSYYITQRGRPLPADEKGGAAGKCTKAEKTQDQEQRKHVVSEIVSRSRMLAALIKAERGYQCEVCGLTLEDKYVDLGNDFLEAHHLVPVASKKKQRWNATAESLAGLCANCHRMMHRLLWKRPIKNEAEGRRRVGELRRIVERHEK